MKSPLARDLVEAVLAPFKPRDILFWTGSGVSLDVPTSLPSGAQLTERVADQFFLPGTLDTIRSYYRALEIVDAWGEPRQFPRLEFLLGVAETVYGDDTGEVLSDMGSVKANWLHRFYAEHLALGGKHITANFDEAIEASMPTSSLRKGVIHFHGSYDPNDMDQLGMTIARIEQGLATGTTEAMRLALREAKVLVVAGYSGSDYFDVDPLIARMAAKGDISHLSVLWIAHSKTKNGGRVVDASFPLPMPRLLASGGCNVWWLEAPTRLVHEHIASLWGADIPDPAVRTRPVWQASWEPEKSQLSEASLQLWHSMGVPRETAALLQSYDGDVPAGRCNVEALVAWLEGRYTDARGHWAACPERTTEEILHNRERIGATLWVSGRLLRAYWVLSRAIQYGHKNDVDVLAPRETISRVVEHMSRTPELRWLSRLLSRGVEAVLPRPEEAQSTHAKVRFSDLQRVTNEQAPDLDQLGEFVEGLTQVESLNGLLNYRHRQLRDRVAAGESVDGAGYRKQWSQQTAIGAIGDAGRVMFLPGAERVFSWKEMRAATAAIQFSYWQRVRTYGYWCMHRVPKNAGE